MTTFEKAITDLLKNYKTSFENFRNAFSKEHEDLKKEVENLKISVISDGRNLKTEKLEIDIKGNNNKIESIKDNIKKIEDNIDSTHNDLSSEIDNKIEKIITDERKKEEDFYKKVDDYLAQIPTPKDGKDAEVNYEVITKYINENIPEPEAVNYKLIKEIILTNVKRATKDIKDGKDAVVDYSKVVALAKDQINCVTDIRQDKLLKNKLYIDFSDGKTKTIKIPLGGGSSSSSLSTTAIKSLYESNANTNAFTDVEKEELKSLREQWTDTNEPTGFIREFKETIGYIELCTDGTKVISVNWNGQTTVRTNGQWIDGTTANAREFAISPVPYSGTIDILNEETDVIVNRADTRDISINGGTYYSIYVEGIKHNITTKQVVELPNQSGLQFIYHTSGGTLALDTVFSFDYFEDRPITATVYGNAVTQELVNFGDERHGIQMDGFTHRYLHFTQGTQYVSGMGLNGVSNGSTTYTSIDAGKAYDEDIYISAPSQTDAPFIYRTGDAWTVLTDNTDIAYVVGGNSQFNCDTAYVNYGIAGVDYIPTGNYELRDVTGNDRMIMFFCLTNNKQFPYVKILGQKVYNASGDARDDVGTAVNDLLLLGLPSPEFLPLYAIIVDSDGEVDDISGEEVYIDLREAIIGGSGSVSGIATTHSNLLGRSDANSHPATAISYDNATSGLSATTVKSAIDEIVSDANILVSPNGTRYLISVENDGSIITTAV
jgi:hypothetical protein